jgi:hypothetical protein
MVLLTSDRRAAAPTEPVVVIVRPRVKVYGVRGGAVTALKAVGHDGDERSMDLCPVEPSRGCIDSLEAQARPSRSSPALDAANRR